MRKWIEFSECNYKLLLFLIYPIARRSQYYVNKYFIDDDDKDRIPFKTFRHFLSFIFSGVILLISKYKRNSAQKTKKLDSEQNSKEEEVEEDEQNSNNIEQIEIIHQKLNKKRKKKSILYLISLSFLGILSYSGRYLFQIYFKENYAYSSNSIRTFFEMANYSVLSYFLINQKLYLHHIISFLCITIILIIILSFTFEYLTPGWYFHLIFHFCFEFLYALYDVLIKRYMNKYFKNPFFIMFFIGIFNSVLSLLYELISYNINPELSGIKIGFEENINDLKDFFLFLLDLICEYFWNLGIWLLIFYFSPCHFFISEYVSELIFFIDRAINEEEFYSDNLIVISVCYIIIFFFCLVFNEVIILNFCGLDFNTRKKISEREKEEYNYIKNNVSINRESILDETEDE